MHEPLRPRPGSGFEVTLVLPRDQRGGPCITAMRRPDFLAVYTSANADGHVLLVDAGTGTLATDEQCREALAAYGMTHYHEQDRHPAFPWLRVFVQPIPQGVAA